MAKRFWSVALIPVTKTYVANPTAPLSVRAISVVADMNAQHSVCGAFRRKGNRPYHKNITIEIGLL